MTTPTTLAGKALHTPLPTTMLLPCSCGDWHDATDWRAQGAAAAVERTYQALRAMFIAEGRRPVTLIEIEATIQGLRDTEAQP